eukprot:gene9272-biopygen9187
MLSAAFAHAVVHSAHAAKNPGHVTPAGGHTAANTTVLPPCYHHRRRRWRHLDTRRDAPVVGTVRTTATTTTAAVTMTGVAV